jgi:hypothetical protein
MTRAAEIAKMLTAAATPDPEPGRRKVKPAVVTVQQVCGLLQVSRMTAIKMLHDVPSISNGGKKLYMIDDVAKKCAQMEVHP